MVEKYSKIVLFYLLYASEQVGKVTAWCLEAGVTSGGSELVRVVLALH